jgi:uncharacterized iron-regulated membrane protein
MSLQLEKDGFFRKSHQLVFDQYTGAVIKSKFYKDASTGDKLKATNYNMHTGKVFGLVGQLFVFFASLIVASLPITGFLMWNRRRLAIKRNENQTSLPFKVETIG